MNSQQAFLATLAFAEGTSRTLHTQNDGYDVIVTGHDGVHETFTDYSHHPFDQGRPAKFIGVFNGKEVYSSASGRYQIIRGTWDSLKLRLKLSDFTPASQDAAALELLRECGSLAKLEDGDIQGAIIAGNHTWASLPGSTAGQGGQSMQTLLAKYQENLSA